MKHFLKENDWDNEEIEDVFNLAFDFKHNRIQRPTEHLRGQTWGMLFFKNSTRTRVSFEVGINELGGRSLILDQSSTQIGRGESIADTTRVLSRYLDGLVIRAHGHEIIEEFSSLSEMPIINALTDFLHPCQIYADCMTILEKLGNDQNPFIGLRGKKLAFYGDTACNMANSWVLMGAILGMEISLCGPHEFQPKDKIKQLLQAHNLPQTWTFSDDPKQGADGADIVYTDVWVSMGCENEQDQRKVTMSPFQVNEDTFANADANCLFMHCMPAHPGEEVCQTVIDSDRSILFDQAENRLHMQKGILAKLSSASSKN
jgi:ornithine carbamoyltransferase